MNKIKLMVSKQRRRYKEDGYDLDLTCILYLLPFMSYPTEIAFFCVLLKLGYVNNEFII